MGNLSWHKLKEYIPAMLMTNLSTLLLITVDGVVAGNLVGTDALASINIFYPVSVLTGAITMLASSAISISLATAMGKNDQAELDNVKGIALRAMILTAVVASIVQIPVVWLVIKSYGLSDEIFAMTMQYAVGIMLCTPLGIVSSVGTYQLQIAGKMKVLMKLSLMEGIANLLFDLFFMGVLDIGVAGAGFGTACANVLRCSATVIYMIRCTDMYKSSKKKVSIREVMELLGVGVPDSTNNLMLALQSYLIMKIILAAFGAPGGAIKGVTTLCFSVANVLVSGVSASVRPMMGLYAGGDDKEGLKILMRQGSILDFIFGALAFLVIEIRPDWFYTINGVHDIPDGGELAVRLYAPMIAICGFTILIRMYLTNRKDSKYATVLTIVGNATLPLYGYILFKIAPAPFIFLSYPLTEITLFTLASLRYKYWKEKDRKEAEEKREDIVFYMTVRPEDAVEASRQIRKYADGHGINQKISYRVALCMEEMVAYAQQAEKTGLKGKINIDKRLHEDMHKLKDDDESVSQALATMLGDIDDCVSVEIMVRFKGKDAAVFVAMDDGRCIALDKNEETDKLITNNYALMRKLAKSVEYQYILNMNYTRFTF